MGRGETWESGDWITNPGQARVGYLIRRERVVTVRRGEIRGGGGESIPDESIIVLSPGRAIQAKIQSSVGKKSGGV